MINNDFNQELLDADTLDKVRALASTYQEAMQEALRWTDKPRYDIYRDRVDQIMTKAQEIMTTGEPLPAEVDAPEIGLPAGVELPVDEELPAERAEKA
jgi:hypothetical protein